MKWCALWLIHTSSFVDFLFARQKMMDSLIRVWCSTDRNGTREAHRLQPDKSLPLKIWLFIFMIDFWVAVQYLSRVWRACLNKIKIRRRDVRNSFVKSNILYRVRENFLYYWGYFLRSGKFFPTCVEYSIAYEKFYPLCDRLGAREDDVKNGWKEWSRAIRKQRM